MAAWADGHYASDICWQPICRAISKVGMGISKSRAFTQGEIKHFFHDNGNVNNPWQPGQIIAPSGRSQKVCQLTGNTDFQYRAATSNQSQTRFSVAGTDLGYPFEHDGRLFFLFGDTAGSTPDGRDSIASTTSTNLDACPHLDWVADGNVFRPIHADGVSLGYFEVPTTGFSANGSMYVFVWTDHRNLFRKDSQGNEVLLRDPRPRCTVALRRSGTNLPPHLGSSGRQPHLPFRGRGKQCRCTRPPGHTGQGAARLWRWKVPGQHNPYLAYIPLNVVERKSPRYLLHWHKRDHPSTNLGSGGLRLRSSSTIRA